jgi:putative membrane protein
MSAGSDDVGAEHRTRLAGERTYLAWWRTAIAALAVGLGVGKVAPSLSDEPTWPYVVLGVGFSLLGIACAAYAYARQREIDRAIDRGELAPPDDRMSALLSGGAVVLGVGLVALLLSS